MLHNELKTCSTTTFFSQNPMNYLTSQASLGITHPMGLMLPYPPATPPTPEPITFPHTLNIDENNSVAKQHSKTKSSDKSKTTFKPYNRPVFCTTGSQNVTSDASSSYKADILSNSVNALSAYSNLFNTALTHIDLSNKNLVPNSSGMKEHNIPEALANYTDITAFKPMTTTQAPSSRLPSTSQLRAQFSNHQPVNAPNINSPTKRCKKNWPKDRKPIRSTKL
ncbi:hypothetical protein EVAR_69884_1 [Eumeta japonica]|uniref:Uncharacterized protein n=1 Tax=Eumeta variegata TaxID=151549 RepID=A0A4C1SJA5_EUMVA|nr:hypothetical protein EVAR_69884_1 [Eumeta japonica]